jgi:hypothetical protein
VLNIYFNSLENEDWEKFFPNRDRIYGNCKFHFNEEEILNNKINIDFFVCFNRLEQNKITKNINFYNSLIIACEPPSIKRYNKKFLNQFNHIFCSDPKYYINLNCHLPVFPIHVGVNRDHQKKNKDLYFDEILNLKITKKKLISVIVTNKSFCKEHQIRSKIISDILEFFGDEIDVFGRDSLFLSDKRDALQSYHYHICIENYFGNNFFTEKILDPLLMNSNPIYLGSKNIDKFFDTRFYELTHDRSKNLELIKSILAKKNHYFEFEKQKEMVINKYNFFKYIAEFVEKNISSEKKYLQFRPENNFLSKFIMRLKRFF